MSMDRGRAGFSAVDRSEPGQSTVMVKFIHAGKPPLCAVVGSRQSTVRRLSKGRSGVWQESGRCMDRQQARAWAGDVQESG
jgi:hypothetical protein